MNSCGSSMMDGFSEWSRYADDNGVGQAASIADNSGARHVIAAVGHLKTIRSRASIAPLIADFSGSWRRCSRHLGADRY